MADFKLKVQAGPHRRIGCPVSVFVKRPGRMQHIFDLLDRLRPRERTGTLVSQHGETPCQVHREEDGVRVSWIVEDLPAGETAFYELHFGGQAAPGDGVELLEADNRIQVRIDGTYFTSYCFGKDLVRPHLYPVIGPYGDGITRRLIKPGEGDHHHHRSIWISHGHVNGWNNWGEGEGHAWTRHQRFEGIESGPVYGRIVSISNWEGAEAWRGEHGSNVICEERAEWTFHRTGSDVRIFDLHLTLTAPKIDLLFGDTKEGGLASIRVAESMEVRSGEGGKIENAIGGANEDETWGKRAAWCHYTGPVNGNRVGVAIMDHPDSFRHPTYWHVRNYGLMTANPFGHSHFHGDPERRGNHVLPPGESLTGHYRFFVHKGDAAEGQIAERYHDFAHPPNVEVE